MGVIVIVVVIVVVIVIVIVIVIVVSTEQIGVPATGVILGKLISTPKKN